MRFPMIPLFLAGLCTGFPLALGQRGTNCVPTKAQVILREKMAELDSGNPVGSLDRASQPTLPPAQEAKAREALQQKLTEKPATPAALPATQPLPPAPVTPVLAAAAPAPQPVITTPVSRTGLTPEQEAKVRETLRQQMESEAAPTPVRTAAPTAQETPPAPKPAPDKPAAPAKPAPAPKPSQAPTPVAPASAPRVAPAATTAAPAPLTAEQEAKAREALRQQMESLQPPAAPAATVQSAPTTAPAPAPKPASAKPAPAPQPAGVVTAPPPAPRPAAVAATGLTAEQEAQAREALRRQTEMMDPTPPPATVQTAPSPAPVVVPTPAPAPRRAPVAAPEPEADLPALSSSQEALVREALNRRMSELNAAAAPSAPEPAPSPAPTPIRTPTPTPTAPIVSAPPPAAPLTVQPSEKTGMERLAELTEQYRAGEMTPAEYHRERAKIIRALR